MTLSYVEYIVTEEVLSPKTKEVRELIVNFGPSSYLATYIN